MFCAYGWWPDRRWLRGGSDGRMGGRWYAVDFAHPKAGPRTGCGETTCRWGTRPSRLGVLLGCPHKGMGATWTAGGNAKRQNCQERTGRRGRRMRRGRYWCRRARKLKWEREGERKAEEEVKPVKRKCKSKKIRPVSWYDISAYKNLFVS